MAPKRKHRISKTTLKMHTKNPGHLCEIDWKIDNLLKFPNHTFSSKVKLGRGCKTNLNIIIRIKECENYSDFFIGYERTDQRKLSIRVVFDFQLINSKGDVYMRTTSQFSPDTAHKVRRFLKIKFADPDYFSKATKVSEDEIRDPDDDILKNLVSNGLVVWDEESIHKVYSLPDDSINVKGSVKVFACCVPLRTTPIHQSSTESASTVFKPSELMSDLKSAFIGGLESGQFTDVSLWVEGESVKAHKFILSARSPKFKRLLDPDYEGNSANEIVVEGVDKNELLHFLQYLYTGIVGAVKWDMVEKLYEIAKEFEVSSLLEQCRNKLISGLKDRRACRAMIFAKNNKDEQLKMATINYLKVIFYEYQKSNIWIDFRKEHPEMANEVMHFVVADL